MLTAQKKEFVEELPDGRLLVSVCAKPKSGLANERVCSLLAEYFGVTAAHVTIARGQTSPGKTIVLS